MCNRFLNQTVLTPALQSKFLFFCTVSTADWRTKVHSCVIMQRPSWLKCFNTHKKLLYKWLCPENKFDFDLMISRVISMGRLGQDKIYQF